MNPERWRGQGETGDPRSRDDFPCLAQGTQVLSTHGVNDGVIPTLIDTPPERTKERRNSIYMRPSEIESRTIRKEERLCIGQPAYTII